MLKKFQTKNTSIIYSKSSFNSFGCEMVWLSFHKIYKNAKRTTEPNRIEFKQNEVVLRVEKH